MMLDMSIFPCQPYSCAGKRQGHEDERAIWPEFVRIVRDVAPTFVFLENVPRFLKYIGPVYDELRGMGFHFAPPLRLAASAVGGPHRRCRLFVLAAHSSRAGWTGWTGERGDDGEELAPAQRVRGDAAADADNSRRLPSERGVRARQSDAEGRSGSSAHALRAELWHEPRRGGRCGWVFDRERQTFRHHAHGSGVRCRIDGTPWASESPPVRVDHGPAHRADQLRCIGNAVVPAVVAEA